MMMKRSSFTVREMAKSVFVFAIGVGLWVGANIAFETTEPWDSAFYLSVSYPLALAISAGLGFAFAELPCRWGLIIMLAQFPVMVIQSGTGPLIAVGILLLAVLSVPAMASALAGAAFRRRFAR
ncbi:hypothetical protein [Sphingomonas sp.]|uniref:hypothetical protein n=1 Tax=Sphingomonas sp. TaxID=28214 RepID=UPI0035A8A333